MKYVPKRLERTADISRGARGGWDTLLGGVQVLAVLGVLYLVLGFVADLLAEKIPSSWEARFGRAPALEQIDTGLTRVEDILERLLEVATVRPLPYRVLILDHDIINAFAFPGGTIAVTRGLLDAVESDVGMAMVVGHEIGHHDARHVLKRLGRVVLIAAPVMALSGDAASWIDDLLHLGEGKYSRDQEREADEIGLRLVFDAYGTTEGALEFFEHVADEQGDVGRWAGLAASHPPTKERIDSLRSQAAELMSGRE